MVKVVHKSYIFCITTANIRNFLPKTKPINSNIYIQNGARKFTLRFWHFRKGICVSQKGSLFIITCHITNSLLLGVGEKIVARPGRRDNASAELLLQLHTRYLRHPTPCCATVALCLKPLGFFCFDSSVVAASANELNASSRLVILSRRLSLCNPLYCLYSLTLKPLHCIVIISVNVAYWTPSSTPVRFHSSVSYLRISMLLRR